MKVTGSESHLGSEWDDWEDDDAVPEEEAFVLVQAPSSIELKNHENDEDGFVLTNDDSKYEGASDTCRQEKNGNPSVGESLEKFDRKFGEEDDLSAENKGFGFSINVFGTFLLVTLLLIGEVWQVHHYIYHWLPPKPTMGVSKWKDMGENALIQDLPTSAQQLVMLEHQDQISAQEAAKPLYDGFETLEMKIMKQVLAEHRDLIYSSFLNEVPTTNPVVSNQGALLMLSASPSPPLPGGRQELTYQDVGHETADRPLSHTPASGSPSGRIPSTGYILADLNTKSSTAPLPPALHEPQIPARSLIPFATPRSPQAPLSSEETPMRRRCVESGPTFNETKVSLNNISSTSTSVLVETTGSTVFVGHRVKSKEDYTTIIKVYKQVFVMFTEGPMVNPVWSKLAVRVMQEKPSVIVAAVDCSQLVELCEEMQITVFPTTVLLGSSRREVVSIDFGRKSVDILMHLLERSRSRFAEPVAVTTTPVENDTRENALTPQTFANFVQKYDSVFVAFYHPENLAEAYFAPLWNAFLLDVKSKKLPLEPATVDCTLYSTFCSKQGIKHFPSLRWFDQEKPIYPDNADKGTFKRLSMFAKSMLRRTLKDKQARAASSTAIHAVDGDSAKVVAEPASSHGHNKKPPRRTRKNGAAKPRRVTTRRERETAAAEEL